MIRESAMTPDELSAFAVHQPALTVAMVLGVLGAGLLVWQATTRTFRGRRAEDVLTLATAGIATGVAAQGMWRFFGDVLHFSGLPRLLLFAFIEVAVVTSAVRARASMRAFGHGRPRRCRRVGADRAVGRAVGHGRSQRA